MADSSSDDSSPATPPPSVRRPASSSGDRSESAPISKAPPSLSRASVPPSEPRSTSRGSFSQLDLAAADRPARLQMIVALVLGLVLVAIPLYLWRRPRADAVAVTGAGDGGAPTPATSAAEPPPADDKPTLSDPKSLACHDPGPKKTAAEQCDHLVEVEKAFAKAIQESADCVPKDAGGGAIVYVADVSFKRKAVAVATPKDGRTLRSAKVVAACQSAVKTRLSAVPLESITHAHARYKIAITATYPSVSSATK
jgi:hypothetical protein